MIHDDNNNNYDYNTNNNQIVIDNNKKQDDVFLKTIYCHFPLQIFVFDNLENFYIHCNNINDDEQKEYYHTKQNECKHNNVLLMPKIITLQSRKNYQNNLWLNYVQKIQCYGFFSNNNNNNNNNNDNDNNSKKYIRENLIYKFKNFFFDHPCSLNQLLPLINLKTVEEFDLRAYIHVEVYEKINILVQWSYFWNIVYKDKVNNEFCIINKLMLDYNNNNLTSSSTNNKLKKELITSMTCFEKPQVTCFENFQFIIKNRFGYDPLSTFEIDNYQEQELYNTRLNTLRINELLQMDDYTQSLLLREHEDDMDWLPTNEQFSSESLSTDNNDDYNNIEEESSTNEEIDYSDQESLYDDYGNYIIKNDNENENNNNEGNNNNKYKIIMNFDNDGNYNEIKNDYKVDNDGNNHNLELKTYYCKNKSKKSITKSCSLCMQDCNNLIYYNNNIFTPKDIDYKIYTFKNKNVNNVYKDIRLIDDDSNNETLNNKFLNTCMIKCPCGNKKHLICLQCLYSCFMSELNIMIQIGYTQYNNLPEKHNSMLYRYCVEPFEKKNNISNNEFIQQRINNKISDEQLLIIMNWINKGKQIENILNTAKLSIYQLMSFSKKLSWYFYNNDVKNNCQQQLLPKKYSFEHILDIDDSAGSQNNLLFYDFYTQSIWFQIEKILDDNNSKITVTCPECKHEIEKTSCCNALRHCDIDVCYFCGMFSRKYDYLPSSHWDNYGKKGCPRYYENDFCNNNLNDKIKYYCEQNKCYSDNQYCSQKKHTKGIFYLNLKRQFNMLCHKIVSLPIVYKLMVYYKMNAIINQIDNKQLYRYNMNVEFNSRKLLLISWIMQDKSVLFD